jgi:hypothetical protein
MSMKPFTLLLMIFFVTLFYSCKVKKDINIDSKTYKISKLERTNTEVQQYINFIENSLEKKDFDTLIRFCLSDYYNSQKELEISDEQFIYELFNMTYPNTLSDSNYIELIRATLHQIVEVTTLKYSILNNEILGKTYHFEGEIHLKKLKKVNFNYTIIQLNNSFKIFGAVR